MLITRALRAAPQFLAKVKKYLARQAEQNAYATARQRPIWPDSVLYEAYTGNGALCHPEAIFRHLLSRAEFHNFRHIWVLNSLKDHAHVVAEFKATRKVIFVVRGTRAYYRALARAQYLINNQTFPAPFAKRPEQTFLNTWHGTPLKKMGYDRPSGAAEVRNTIRSFLQADYLLSPNEYTTEVMYRGAYKLNGIYNGQILEYGSPRVDLQDIGGAERERVIAQLRSSGVEIESSKKTVLYAPTWKGMFFHQAAAEADALKTFITELQTKLASNVQILVKVHQSVFAQIKDDPELAGVLVPNDIPSNTILGLVDGLIADYSSIFFDYMASRKPIYFYVPDLEAYVRNIGIYIDFEELPGEKTVTVESLAAAIDHDFRQYDQTPWLDTKYRAAADRFTASEDFNAARRVVDHVFLNKVTPGQAKNIGGTDKVRLLISAGGFRPNGMTMSCLNLLANLDPNRYDITLLVATFNDAARKDLLNRLPDHVRVMMYVGGYLGSSGGNWNDLQNLKKKMVSKEAEAWNRRDQNVVETDWQRSFGSAQFDHAIDFSGYGAYWAHLLTEADVKSRLIWQHNDLKAEWEAHLAGRRPGAEGLRSVFQAYRHYDYLVSVSPALKEVNEENLAQFSGGAKFVSVRNSLDLTRLHEARAASENSADGLIAITGQVSLADLLERAAQQFSWQVIQEQVTKAITIDELIDTEPHTYTFVTAGRLSPEKNHERLIRAFHTVWKRHSNARLVIMGSGPLQTELAALIRGLGLEQVVRLPGQVAIPFVVMNEADCFVLSSDHEGQPMVILVAKFFGLPILTTAFSSVHGALDEGEGLIVDRSVPALAHGMQEAIAGKIPVKDFDTAAYNAAVLEEFLSFVS